MSTIECNVPIYYICDGNGKVLQIRKKVFDRYLIEYTGRQGQFAYVTENEFNEIPPNTKKIRIQ